MPTYRVTDSVTGKTLKLTGDSPPTEQELVGIFEEFRPKPKTSFMDKAKKVVSDIGQGMTGMAKEEATGGQAVGETGLALGTGLGAMGLGAIGQIMTHVKERPWAAETTKKAKQVRKGAEELFSYQPKSEGGKQLTETLGSIIGLPAILGNILERDPETAAKFAEGIPNQTIKDVAQFTAMSLQKLGEPVRYSMDQLGIGGGTIEDLSKLMLEFYGYGKLNQGIKGTGAAIKKGKGIVQDANTSIGGMKDLLTPSKQPTVPLERSPMPTPAARSPYSPELASQLSDKPLALPEGQGFEILPDGTQRPILRTREFEETPPIIGGTPTATDIVPLRTNVALDQQAFLRDAQDRVLLDKVDELSGGVELLPQRESATGLYKPEEYMGKRPSKTEEGGESVKPETKPVNEDIQILTDRGADPEVLNGLTPDAVSSMRWMSDQMEAKRIITDLSLGRDITPQERTLLVNTVGEKAIRKLEKENQKASKTEPVPETASTAVKTEVKPEGVTTIPPKEVNVKNDVPNKVSGQKKGIPEEGMTNKAPEVGQATGEQSGTVNLSQKGASKTKAKEPDSIRIEKPEVKTEAQKELESTNRVFDELSKGMEEAYLKKVKSILDEGNKKKSVDKLENYINKEGLEDFSDKIEGIEDIRTLIDEYRDIKRSGMTPEEFRDAKQEAFEAIQEAVDGLEIIKDEIPFSPKKAVKTEVPKVEKTATNLHGTEDPNLRVAVKDENGKVYVGEKGEIHADLADRVGLLDKYTEGTKIESGFADKDGRFIRRSTTDESINPAELNLKDRDLTDPVVQNNTISEILEVYKEDVNGRKKAVGEFTQELKRQTESKKTEPVKTEVKEPVKETVKESVKEPVKKSATKLSKPTADTIEQALNKKLNLINKQIDEIETQNRDAIKNRQDVPEARLNRLYKLKQDRDITEKALLGIERKPEKTVKKKTTAEARTIEASLEDKKAAMELGIPTEEYMAGKKAKKGEVTLYSNPIAPVFQEIKNRFVKFTDNLEFRTLAKTSDETFAHFVKRILQDRRIAIKTWEAELKERGINIPDRLSVHMTFERMPSKVADTMLQFERDVKKPLIKSITNLWKESKLTFDDLTEYMQALDAAPRYKAIQNRLKKMKEEAASPEEIAELEKRGSGMSQEEANAILEKYRKTGADKKMDDVAKMIHNIAEARLDLLEKYGLETPEMIKQMREEFGPTYVPWRGKEGVKKYGRTGASYSGSTIKHALGRTSKATENPIAHILNDYQNTVIKIFENEPKRTMLELVREIKDPDITVNEVTLKQRLNKEGQVETYRDAVWSANDTLNPGLDNVIDVMDNGKHYYIKIKGDPLLVRAFQKLPVGSLEALTGGIGKWTRAMAQLKTMYSPEFILTNPFRDMFDAVHGLAAEHKASYVKDALGEYKKSIKECYDYYRNGKTNDQTYIKGKDGSETMANLTKEYMENVQVGFWSAKDISIAERNLGKQLQREVASGIKGGTARTWKAVSDYVSDMSSVTENAMRMAVYRTLRKNGHSVEQAAAYAKNVTLNFNRRGELGWISNLYMFANPGIQGIKRFKDLTTTKRGMKILIGMTSAAVALNIMNRWIAGEDEAGVNNFTKMSAGERSRNLIFMGTDGRPLIKFPLGFQQRLPFGIANSIADVIMGDVHPVKASLDFADVFFDSFNPISGSSITKGTAASFAPSLAKPFFEIESNTDTFGRPIYPKAMIGEDKPESELFFRSVSPISKEIAQGLHRLSGKDKFHSGGIDVSPESIDHVVKNYFGGIGDTLYRAASLAFKTADDMTPISSIGRHEIPIARRFTGANIDQFSQNRFREIIDELRPDKKSIDNANDILKNGDPLSSEYDNAVKTLQEYDDKTELIEKYAERVREVSDINKEIDKVKAEKDMPVWYRRETIEYLEGKKIDIYNQTIWQYNNRKMLKGTEPTEDMI